MTRKKQTQAQNPDFIGYQKGRWAIYLFLGIMAVCQLRVARGCRLPAVLPGHHRIDEAAGRHLLDIDAALA